MSAFLKELKCSCPLSTDYFKCQQHHISPFPQKRFSSQCFWTGWTHGASINRFCKGRLNFPQTIFILFLTHFVSSSHPNPNHIYGRVEEFPLSRRLTRRVKVNPEWWRRRNLLCWPSADEASSSRGRGSPAPLEVSLDAWAWCLIWRNLFHLHSLKKCFIQMKPNVGSFSTQKRIQSDNIL